MARLLLLVATLVSAATSELTAQSDWVSLRWESANGPRDIEYSRSSVKIVGDSVLISIRRDRATALRQDTTIAPESNPWTTMDMLIDCGHNVWRPKWFASVDSTGAPATEGNFSRWVPIEAKTLSAVIKLRFCPMS
jgi:hypothetical protein